MLQNIVMKHSSQSPTRLADLLVEATQLETQIKDFRARFAHEPAADEDLVHGLDRLLADVRHLRDSIHDAALDPADELAVPRLNR